MGKKMKWNSGQPIDIGYYLCAIVGRDKPQELYWNGNSWAYWRFQPWEDSEEIIYYMNLSDIPMPEGW